MSFLNLELALLNVMANATVFTLSPFLHIAGSSNISSSSLRPVARGRGIGITNLIFT